MKTLTFVPIVILISIVKSQVSFNMWQQMYNKIYPNPAAITNSRQIFDMNNAFITLINSKSRKSFLLGLNEFTDLTFSQMQSRFFGLVVPNGPDRFVSTTYSSGFMNIVTAELLSTVIPDSIDYSKYSLAVKHQLSCGSCWAFSVVDMLGMSNKNFYGFNFFFIKSFRKSNEKIKFFLRHETFTTIFGGL